MASIFSRPLVAALRHGAWFGLKASLAIFGSVFLAVYGGGAAWWLYVRVARGSSAAIMLVEDQGGARALESEFWMAAGRVVWLTFCCTILSAGIFAVCAALSGKWREIPGKSAHPLDR